MGLHRLGDVRQADVGIISQIAKPEKRCLVDRILVKHGLERIPGLVHASGPGCPHAAS